MDSGKDVKPWELNTHFIHLVLRRGVQTFFKEVQS